VPKFFINSTTLVDTLSLNPPYKPTSLQASLSRYQLSVISY